MEDTGGLCGERCPGTGGVWGGVGGRMGYVLMDSGRPDEPMEALRAACSCARACTCGSEAVAVALWSLLMLSFELCKGGRKLRGFKPP